MFLCIGITMALDAAKIQLNSTEKTLVTNPFELKIGCFVERMMHTFAYLI